MFKKELTSHLILALFYAALVTLWGRYFQPQFLLFWLGSLVGVTLLYLDPLVSAYLTSPDLPFSGQLKQMVSQKQFKGALQAALAHHREQEQPILHSALFQLALTAVGFYVVTSSGSFFGSGLLMGMALHLIRDEVEKWRSTEQLNKMLFWNIHREITEKEQKVYLGIIFAIFALETIFLV